MLCRNPILMVSPALHAAGVSFPGLKIMAAMEEAVALAEKYLRPGRRRVIVFPAGGVSFPIRPDQPAPAAASGGT